MSDTAAATSDDRELAREGYRPQFRRGLGSFTAFAAGFSYLSILTGIVQNFYLGYREAGPAFVWTWPIVFAGQFCLALCFAELARSYPICGGIYAWSRRAGSPLVGWMTGWVYLASLIVTLAAVAVAWQVVLPTIWPGFQLVELTAQNASGKNAAILGAILIAISTVLNVVGTRWLAAIMNVGVVLELVAAVLLVILFAAHAVRGPAIAFHVHGGEIADGFGTIGPFLAAAVMAAYVMYGFDTAGTLAEETVDPRRRAPRAILQALAAAALLGGLLLLFAITGAPDLGDASLGDVAGGLPYLIKQVLGDGLGTVFLVASAIAIFVCTLAVHANTARVLFAMARDGALPFAGRLGKVHPDKQTPHRAAIVIGILGAALLLVSMNFEQLMTALVCVSIVWANLAYLFTTAPLLIARLRRPSEGSYLGRWAFLINLLAVIWGIVLVVNIGWPRESLYGTEWYERFGAPLYTGILLVAGLVVFAIVRPDRRLGGDVA
ncbi:MAG TPA: APC family permease [Gemmataceae bacterium]|jgi:urea carboxylase system permease|nr:APC family permease [Gemmataceae bacterium]